MKTQDMPCIHDWEIAKIVEDNILGKEYVYLVCQRCAAVRKTPVENV